MSEPLFPPLTPEEREGFKPMAIIAGIELLLFVLLAVFGPYFFARMG